MNFVTPEFAFFFGGILLVWQFLQSRQDLRRDVLLGANLFFYAMTGLTFVPLLLTVAVLNWGTAVLLRKGRARQWVIGIDVAAHVALLGFFKYYEFFVLGLESWGLGGMGGLLPVADMPFPVGLSFYSFQGLSYAIDQYRNPDREARSFFDVLLFVSFFPTIMAGPILRAEGFFAQRGLVEEDPGAIEEGFALIVSGLFKKVVLASYLSEHIVRDVFLAPEMYSSWTILAAVYGYTIQIYCDFSGYTDLALGVGRLLGYRLPENFNSPYLALNLQDFWRRWHISLSLWLRDYLYIPLGGSRSGNRYLNLIITMGLGGLWHGSHLRFLVWGLLHGLGLAATHGMGEIRRRWFSGVQFSVPFQRVGMIFSWFVTFHFVAFLWIFFRAEDMDRALEILRRIVLFGQPGEGFAVMVIPAILAGFALQLVGGRVFAWFTAMQARLHWAIQAILIAFLVGFILQMGPDGVLPFIYFQF